MTGNAIGRARPERCVNPADVRIRLKVAAEISGGQAPREYRAPEAKAASA